MRLTSERIILPATSSWGFFCNSVEHYPFTWHCHPEYEITLTLNARGLRYVGDHIGHFGPDDLVLLGSNLPHSWSVKERIDTAQPIQIFVLWFTSEWVQTLTRSFVEFQGLADLFRRAEQGLEFSPETRQRARSLITGLGSLEPRERFVHMLQVLNLLAANAPDCLASSRYGGRITPPRGQRKLTSVLHYIQDNYTAPIYVDRLARRFGMGQSTFIRFFKRHTGQTFTDYVAELRIGKACALLLERDDPVYNIAEKVGYQNLSNFYRQFKAFKQLSPSEFRKRHLP
ncbi:MAG: AraC family transcriptional regulator [Aquisalimonadaceae bacterium]